MNTNTETFEPKQATSTRLTEEETAAVQEILAEELGVQRNQITPEADLHADLSADSLADIEIIMRLEERFAVAITDENAQTVKTVGDVYTTLAQALGR